MTATANRLRAASAPAAFSWPRRARGRGPAAARDLIAQRYSPLEWNIYLFHFSDGDNSSEADNRLCVRLLHDSLLPVANLFGYCQVTSAYGSGNFINVLHEAFEGSRTARGGRESDSNLVTSRVNGRDDIYDSLRTFFGAGK